MKWESKLTLWTLALVLIQLFPPCLKKIESSEYSCGEHHAGHDSATSLLSSQGSQDSNSSQKISQTSSTGTSECHNSGLSNSDVEGEVHKVEVQDELDTSPCINSAASSSKVSTVEMSECSDDVNHSVCDSALYLGSSQGSSDLADCSQTTSLQSTCIPNCDSLSHSVVNGEVHEIMDTCSSADDNCASGCSLLLSDNTDERSISGSQIAATSPRVIVASDRSCDTEEMGQTCSTSSSQQLPENIKDNVHSSMENAEAQVAGSCDTPRGSVLQEKPFEENDCHVKLSSSCQTVWKCSSSGEALPSEGWSEHGRESKTAYTATAGAAEVLECRPSVEMEGECCLERENSIVLPLKRKRSNEECDFACTPVPPVSSVSEDEASLEITRETAEEECSNLSQSYITKNNLTESEMHYLDYKKEKTSLSSANECVNTSRSAYEVHKVIEVIVIDSSDEEETEDSEAEDGKKGRLNIKAEVDSDLDEDGSGSCREMERSAYSSSNVQGYGMSSNILELQNGRRNGDCVRDADGTRSQPVFTSSSQPGAHCSGFEKSISNLKTEAYSSTNPPHTADENSSSLLDSDSQNNSCPRNLSPVFEPQYSLQTSHSTELPSLAHQPHVIQAPQNSIQNIQELMNYKIHDKLQLPVEFDDDDDDDFNISMGDLDKVYSSDEDGTGILPDGINSSVGSVCSNQFVQHSNAEHSYATCSNGEEPVVKTKHAGSSSKSVANDSSSIAPDLPGNNRCWAVSEHDVVHQMQECNSVLKAIENSLLAVEGIDKSHMDQWRDQITELLKQTVSPKTYIAVVGDTGAGKSCLLNALLDEEALLPTSAMRACTASVVEVSCNLENQSYEADVEFLTEEEWYKELEALIKDLKDKHGNFRKRLDPKSEAGVALSRVKAVYGSIAEVEQLKQIQDVTKFLGKTHHITEKKVTEFRSKIERFIDSSADSAKGRKGGEYWPIVKRVQLRVPTADVLRSGAVLVDLPGIKDSNAARNSVAKEYLKTCSAVWVVANITRAVDDKTAKDMLNESLRTQLFMDGQYGRIAFICTKTDCFSVSEICRAVHINDRIQPLEDENAELEKRINQIKTAKEMLYSKLEEQNIKDDTGKGPDCHANELRNAILEKDIMMNSLQRKVQSNCQAVAVECVKARNKYSKKQIQMDFICGMQEIKRASNEDDDGSDEDDLMSVASEDFGLDSIFEESRKLPVFTVSSKEYLKLRGKLPREGPPQVFNSMEDTEIPALKNFTIKTAMKQSVVTAEKLIRSVTSFISHVVTYLTNQRAQDESFQARIRETVKTCLSRVKKILQEAVSECNKSVEKAFLVVISTHVSMGVKRAVAACEETAKTWASPDKPGKYPYATYRAICVRQGVYTSRAFGHIDLNEELIQPVSTTISVVWNQVFSKDLPEYLDKFKTNMLRKLKEFFREVKGKLREMNMSTTAVEYIQRQQMEAVEAELSNFIIDLKDNIMQRQRDISRILTPSVQVHMSPCFTECAKQSGAGCFQRMKTHMCNFIQTEKVTMFHSAGDKLIEQLTFLQNEICGRLTTVLEELCESLTVQFEPVLKPVKKNKGVIPDLVRICRQVREICQRSHIEFVLNDPVEEQEEEASSSTSGAVKIKVDANELNFLQGTCDIVIEDDTACLKKYKSHVQITGNGVYIKGTRQFPSLCVKFTHVAFCEFCHYMYYLRLHINPSYINVPVVRTHCDQLNMNPLKILLIMDNVNINNFCRLMEYISKKHGGPPWFQKLNMEQGVDKLRRLGVIYQCSDNKKEEPTVVATAVPVFTSSSALSSHSSVPCSYQTSMPAGTILYPFGRKRGSDPLQTSALYDGKIRITSQGPHTVSQSPETNSISLVQSNPNYREMQTVIGTVSRWPDPNNIPSTSRGEVSRLTLWTPTLLSATTSEQIKVEEGTQRKMSHVPAATGSLYISSGSIHFEKLTAKKENEK
ncbi:uncharacterized protein LOC122798813 isoform X2 [Protopterus annectens]|uniref:uncharacterized protein LOC122798813 isoform X2 n=1 Tax=Protopterus annectens TaxID=7888 RepID=UPI001CFAB65B|nr:uncharacterized protein LOC122798813 isoform X2 [Protopterus annectens]